MELISKLADINAQNYYVTWTLLILILCIVGWNLLRSFLPWFQFTKKVPPGPLGLPFLGYLPFLGDEPHKTLWNMKEKYGDLIGIYMGQKYTVILNEYNVMKDVLSHPAVLDRSSIIFDHIPRAGFPAQNGKTWIEQRRFCVSAMRELGVGRRQWEDLMTEEAINFTQEIRDLKGEPRDISYMLATSIASIVILPLIGRKLDKENEADKIQLATEYSTLALALTGPTQVTTIFPGLRRLFEIFKIAGYDRAKNEILSFSNFLREEIVRHKSSPMTQDTYDFITIYLEKLQKLASTDRHVFSEIMLEGNVNVLFLGFTDSIYSSLEWIIRLMAKYKDVQRKVYKELMEVVGKDGKARYEERHKIPFTFATLMEVQRFSSIVPLSTTRRVTQDIQIKGYTIPKGSEISANLWALHNDPAYWERPDEFLPERFLSDGGTNLIKQPPSFAPFSVGRRNCPGETVAWMEILSYTTEIVKRFEITTPPGIEPEFEVKKGLVNHLKPQALCFIERNEFS